MALYPYPSTVPTKEVFDLVIAALKGNPDPKESVHAIWTVIGFGLSQWDVHPPVVGAAPLDAADAAALLSTANGAAAAIPWNLLVPVLIELLARLLKR